MKKKIITTMMLCFSMLIGLFMVGCGVNKIESITIIGNAYSEFLVGEVYDYSKIQIEAKFEDGTTQTINGNSDYITVTGFNTQNPTTNGKMTIVFDDEKSTAKCTIDYVVYSQKQTVQTDSDIVKITNQTAADDNGILFFIKNGSYDLTNYPIKRDLKFIVRNGVDVTFKNIKILQATAKQNLKVDFTNVKMSNTDTNKAYILTCEANKDYDLDLTLEKCVINANGVVKGIMIPQSGDVKIVECDFNTPGDTDCFDTVINCNALKRNRADKLVIDKNDIICKFAYCFYEVTNATITNNYIDADLQSGVGIGGYHGDSTVGQQTLYVVEKNPVVIHNSFYKDDNLPADGKYTIIFTNNTVRNAQNVIRTYDLDKIDYANLTYDFTDTKLHNCAVLVNASTDSYQTLPKLLATIEAKVTTGWNKEYKAAIQMDTVIEIPRENFYREVIERTGAYVYYDFTGENEAHAILTIDDVAYTYIGKVKNNHYIKADNDVCYVIKSIGYGSTGDVIKFESQQGTLTMDIAEAKAYTLNDVKTVLGVGTSISD